MVRAQIAIATVACIMAAALAGCAEPQPTCSIHQKVVHGTATSEREWESRSVATTHIEGTYHSEATMGPQGSHVVSEGEEQTVIEAYGEERSLENVVAGDSTKTVRSGDCPPGVEDGVRSIQSDLHAAADDLRAVKEDMQDLAPAPPAPDGNATA